MVCNTMVSCMKLQINRPNHFTIQRILEGGTGQEVGRRKVRQHICENLHMLVGYLFSSLQFTLKSRLILLHRDFKFLKLLKLNLNFLKLFQLQFIFSSLNLQLLQSQYKIIASMRQIITTFAAYWHKMITFLVSGGYVHDLSAITMGLIFLAVI